MINNQMKSFLSEVETWVESRRTNLQFSNNCKNVYHKIIQSFQETIYRRFTIQAIGLFVSAVSRIIHILFAYLFCFLFIAKLEEWWW